MLGRRAGSPIAVPVYARVQCRESKIEQEKVQFYCKDDSLFLSSYYLSMLSRVSSEFCVIASSQNGSTVTQKSSIEWINKKPDLRYLFLSIRRYLQLLIQSLTGRTPYHPLPTQTHIQFGCCAATQCWGHRRRIKTEEKAKVVAVVWGT